MSVSLAYQTNVTVTEILETNVPAASSNANKEVKHTGFNQSSALTATTTPPVTTVAAFEQALTAGAATIDLQALTGSNGAAVDGTGLKVQAMKFRNKSTNSNTMTLAIGAANGYDAWGTSFAIDVEPGGEVVLYGNDAGSDIGATKSDLDISGTGTETAEVIIVMG